jgi:hypothetical protein
MVRDLSLSVMAIYRQLTTTSQLAGNFRQSAQNSNAPTRWVENVAPASDLYWRSKIEDLEIQS